MWYFIRYNFTVRIKPRALLPLFAHAVCYTLRQEKTPVSYHLFSFLLFSSHHFSLLRIDKKRWNTLFFFTVFILIYIFLPWKPWRASISQDEIHLESFYASRILERWRKLQCRKYRNFAEYWSNCALRVNYIQ